MTDRTDLIVLGRKIGTYLTWDEIEIGVYQYDAFEPVEGLSLRRAQIVNIDFNKGVIEGWQFGGDMLWRTDIISKVKDLPIAAEEQGELFELGKRTALAPEGVEMALMTITLDQPVKKYFNQTDEAFYIRGVLCCGPHAGEVIETEEIVESFMYGTDRVVCDKTGRWYNLGKEA